MIQFIIFLVLIRLIRFSKGHQKHDHGGKNRSRFYMHSLNGPIEVTDSSSWTSESQTEVDSHSSKNGAVNILVGSCILIHCRSGVIGLLVRVRAIVIVAIVAVAGTIVGTFVALLGLAGVL